MRRLALAVTAATHGVGAIGVACRELRRPCQPRFVAHSAGSPVNVVSGNGRGYRNCRRGRHRAALGRRSRENGLRLGRRRLGLDSAAFYMVECEPGSHSRNDGGANKNTANDRVTLSHLFKLTL